jgi:LPS export ABC transporter protein LptC
MLIRKYIVIFSLFFFLFSLFSCTFDYGDLEAAERELPDLVMVNVEYVRVRSADLQARFSAERAERYEKQGVMKIHNFSFEQYGERGEEVNAFGSAVNATVDIDTGDVYMEDGVRLEVESEDIIIEADQLEWLDDPRILSTNEDVEVHILRENGTHFIGIGLHVDARRREWEFFGNVGGTFIQNDDDSESEDGVDGEEDFDAELVVFEREVEDRVTDEVQSEPPFEDYKHSDFIERNEVDLEEVFLDEEWELWDELWGIHK